jgi:hypothetical protein
MASFPGAKTHRPNRRKLGPRQRVRYAAPYPSLIDYGFTPDGPLVGRQPVSASGPWRVAAEDHDGITIQGGYLVGDDDSGNVVPCFPSSAEPAEYWLRFDVVFPSAPSIASNWELGLTNTVTDEVEIGFGFTLDPSTPGPVELDFVHGDQEGSPTVDWSPGQKGQLVLAVGGVGPVVTAYFNGVAIGTVTGGNVESYDGTVVVWSGPKPATGGVALVAAGLGPPQFGQLP